jgi:hypothetical protein
MCQLGPGEQYALGVEAVTRGLHAKECLALTRLQPTIALAPATASRICYQADVPATALRVDSGKTYGQPIRSKAKGMIRLLRSGHSQASASGHQATFDSDARANVSVRPRAVVRAPYLPADDRSFSSALRIPLFHD